MSDQPGFETPAAETEVFKLTRTFEAPPSLVWSVWTEADHLAKWFGPAGLKLVVRSLDLTPGGTFLYGMQMPTGITMWGKWFFRAIEKPNRLSYVVSFCNEAGDPVRHPMAPLWPLEVLVEQSFSESNGKTVFESRSWPINATAEERAVFVAGHAGMQAALGGTFAQLDAHLATLT